ncbi:hypothetical protein AnigIFM60653_010700 [Aspergillus niger]|nr:hypothetical protein AnigIFM60653_010700 [Aspergillus niger]
MEGSANHAAWPLRASGCFVRRDVALLFSAQAQKLGIAINFGVGVTNYLEDSAMGLGIIHTDDGRELSADIVVAADGFGTKSHSVVVDYPTRAVSTGYCVDYPTSMLKDAPALSKALAEFGRPQWRMYNGMMARPQNRGRPGLRRSKWRQLSQAYKWKLCLRKPQPNWTSESGCIVQIGDAARSPLPPSANGAAMALEYSMSLAGCLRLGGKEEAAMATKVHQDLRPYVDVSTHTNEPPSFNIVDLSTAGGKAFLFYGKWLWQHNVDKYATANFEAARQSIELGNAFKNTNLPRGHVSQDWTMESQLAKEMAGIFIQDLNLKYKYT